MIANSTLTVTNAEYLRGIAENDLTVLQKIYDESLPEVIKYVKRNSGTLEDAKDIFQEGILVVFKKVRANGLQLTTSFHVFLFMVCKRMWLKKLKKYSKGKMVALEDTMEFAEDENVEALLQDSKRWALFQKKFKQLAGECRKVLQMLFEGASGKEIAVAMNYSEDYAKRKKYKCKMGLAEMIKKDAEYRELRR